MSSFGTFGGKQVILNLFVTQKLSYEDSLIVLAGSTNRTGMQFIFTSFKNDSQFWQGFTTQMGQKTTQKIPQAWLRMALNFRVFLTLLRELRKFQVQRIGKFSSVSLAKCILLISFDPSPLFPHLNFWLTHFPYHSMYLRATPPALPS